MSWLKSLFYINVPATVDDEKIIVPAFEIPLPDAPALEGTIAVEVENKVVKVALKKKAAPKKKLKGKK